MNSLNINFDLSLNNLIYDITSIVDRIKNNTNSDISINNIFNFTLDNIDISNIRISDIHHFSLNVNYKNTISEKIDKENRYLKMFFFDQLVAGGARESFLLMLTHLVFLKMIPTISGNSTGINKTFKFGNEYKISDYNVLHKFEKLIQSILFNQFNDVSKIITEINKLNKLLI